MHWRRVFLLFGVLLFYYFYTNIVSANSFYWLRQLYGVLGGHWTLVRAFVSSRVDHCNAVLAGAPKVTTDKLQRVMNAAARVVSGIRPWLVAILAYRTIFNVPERVALKLGLMVFNCLHNQAPQYLVDLCQSESSVASRQHLRSANRGLLVVPCHRLSSYGRRAFFVFRRCDMELVTLTVWETRPSAKTPSNVHWRRFYFQLVYIAH